MKISKHIVTTSMIESTNQIVADDIVITDSYIKKLQSMVEANIDADTITWETDDDSISMTTTVRDSIINYNIPIADLSGDINSDVSYIMEAVKDE